MAHSCSVFTNKYCILILCCVLIADLHWERAGVSEPLQKVGPLLWGTGEGISLQGTIPTATSHVSVSCFFVPRS